PDVRVRPPCNRQEPALVRRPASRLVPCRRLLPDRDVLATLSREGLAIPPAPAFAKAHPGELCHQIKLRGPGVPEGNREALESPVHHLEVMRREALGGNDELVKPPSGLAHVDGAHGFT